MIDPDRTNLIYSWIIYHKAKKGSPEYEKHFWAFGQLYDLTQDDPETAWTVILEILKQEQHTKVIEGLAAGPLEDLLNIHGPAFIERVEVEALSNPRFKDLLGGVWKSEIPEEIWKRVQKVSGPKW